MQTLSMKKEPLCRLNKVKKTAEKDASYLFDFEKAKHGIGLTNIETRAALIGAEIHITSSKGKGTQLVLSYQSTHYE